MVFRTEDWVERVYTNGSRRKITLFLARGFDGRPFFHFPERGLLKRNWSERTHQLKLLETGEAPIKVHTLHLSGVKANTRARYILLYGKETVGNPYLFLLGRIPWMVVGEREPFVLLFASCSQSGGPHEIEQAMESLLVAALEYIQNP